MEKTERTHQLHRIVLAASQRSTSTVDRPAGQTAQDSAGKLARGMRSTEMTAYEGARGARMAASHHVRCSSAPVHQSLACAAKSLRAKSTTGPGTFCAHTWHGR